MSLTGLLRREMGSPLRGLFREYLPKTKTFVGDLNRELRGLPLNTRPPTDSAVRGLSGTAIDYRLRYYFGVTPITETAAWKGARNLERAMLMVRSAPPPGTFLDFLHDLEEEICGMNPVGVRLPPADELRLARDCVLLSYFEQFYRSAFSVIFDCVQNGSLRGSDDILQLPTTEVVEDVAAMSPAFFESQFPLIAARTVVLNPNFAGSSDVGGADADIIAGDSLIEFKSTAKTGGILLGDDLYQLLSYPCLDYSDEYEIRKVGFSVVRRNALREWDIEELVDTLSGGRTGYQVFRERFHAVALDLGNRFAGATQ